MKMTKHVLGILVIAVAGLYASYKFLKYNEAYKESVSDYKKDKLKELEIDIDNKYTLKNENVAPEDRPYVKKMLDERFNAILFAKTVKEVDAAVKKYNELVDILSMEHESSETAQKIIGSVVEMDKAEKKAAEDRKRDIRIMEHEMKKYQLLSDAFTKSISGLMTQ